MALDVEVKARVSQETKQKLSKIAGDRGEGVKISFIVREAIQEYLERHRLEPPQNYLRVADDKPPEN